MPDPIRLEIDNTQNVRSQSYSSGSGGDGLEARVTHLEEDMKGVKSDLKAIRSDVSYIKGRLDAMPTTMQLIMFAVAVFVASGVMGYFLK